MKHLAHLTHSFWAKAAAFFLAVLFVPLIAFYSVSAYARYSGEFSGDFASSDMCSSLAYRYLNSVGEFYRYQLSVSDEQTALAALAELYPASSTDSNLRLVLIDNTAGCVLYSSNDTVDTAVSGWGGEWSGANGVTLRAYLAWGLPAQDEFHWANEVYRLLQRTGGSCLWMLALLCAAEIFLLVWLARAAGRRADGGITPGWQEKIPFDLYLLLQFILLCCAGALLSEGLNVGNLGWMPALITAVAALVCCAVLVLAFWMTLCARLKLGKWWRNTLICMTWRGFLRLIKRAWHACGRMVHAIPLVWRTAVFCCGASFLIIALRVMRLDVPLLLLLLVLSIFALGFSLELRQLQKGARALAEGDLTHQIDTRHLDGDIRRSAEDLNAIAQGMGIAVEQRLKSERLKTELITNVSHDIKTPLTSIINYVDLLQKEPTDEQRAEYLDVLDRQTQKLKKLTVDLVEMSKASTGNLPCQPTRRSLGELVEQAVGEYAERLCEAGLEPVVTLPEEELFCLADGTLIWRVLDNLLSNACKYAQSGTRLYIDGTAADGKVQLAFKNISRERLNLPAEELMERFVRGDSARSGEGSGLGLNIAQSLMQLQNGALRLDIDGDLFKATLTLPAA